MQPVKLGEGPEALVTRADAEPSPRKRGGRCREQTAGTYSLNGHGDGVLQTTNPRRVRPGRRKPKWQENPPPLKACRFDSDLGQSARFLISRWISPSSSRVAVAHSSVFRVCGLEEFDGDVVLRLGLPLRLRKNAEFHQLAYILLRRWERHAELPGECRDCGQRRAQQ